MADTQTEIELKLQVPAAALVAVSREVAAGKVRRTRLQAIYFDTADRRLAAAGIAVRMRLEGTCWVQTAKAGDAHAMTRHEHNVPVQAPSHGALPELDLHRHAGTRAGELVEAALVSHDGAPPAALAPLYRTDIERTHREVSVPDGRVELALDIGRILADDREWAVCELEIELVSGHPDAVIGTAGDWATRHGLWLDTRSKAERGNRLARGDRSGAPVRAVTPQGPADAKAREACRKVLLAAMAHVLPNLSEVASGEHTPEHVHQLRTGLRRIGTALRLFKDITSCPYENVQQPIDDARRDLGPIRDHEAVSAAWGPALQLAGAPMPSLAHQAALAEHAAAIARRPALTCALLSIQSWCVPDGTLGPQPADFPEALCNRLRRWHKQLIRSARQYDCLDDDARHQLRRRAKRLRDAVTATQFLFRAKPLAAPLALLRKVQTELGRAQDLSAAIAACRSALDEGHGATDPRAWFAVGWLTSQQAQAQAAARRAVAALAASKTPRAKAARRKR